MVQISAYVQVGWKRKRHADPGDSSRLLSPFESMVPDHHVATVDRVSIQHHLRIGDKEISSILSNHGFSFLSCFTLLRVERKNLGIFCHLYLRRNEISSPINWSESVANLTKISIIFNLISDYLNFSRSKRVWKYLCSDRKLSKLILCNIFILFFFFFCIHEFLPYRLFERFRLLIAVRNLFDYLNFFFSRAACLKIFTFG